MYLYYAEIYKVFDEFDYDDKNLVKLNLYDFDNNCEGIWMCISPKDKIDYDNKVKDIVNFRMGILCNQSLCGPPYGMLIPYRLNGKNRPTSYINLYDQLITSGKQQPVLSKIVKGDDNSET